VLQHLINLFDLEDSFWKQFGGDSSKIRAIIGRYWVANMDFRNLEGRGFLNDAVSGIVIDMLP
jgi:hypothetical protein